MNSPESDGGDRVPLTPSAPTPSRPAANR
jgi:hypothetical protein